MGNKVCVYAICKNEEQFVDRWMDSMSEADCVVVTDTGSTDGTVSKLRSYGAEVYVEVIDPWRFNVARNRSLEHVPEDADICLCTDLDEVLSPGWREALEASWAEGTTRGTYLYNWSVKPDGSPDVQFTISKAHTRKNYVWRWPVHEHIHYTGSETERVAPIPGMVLTHYPDPQKSRGSYLPLLELAVREEPLSDRMTYYLGREYCYKGMWENCIETLQSYLRLPTAHWWEERAAAMRWIAQSYQHLGQRAQAQHWVYRAIAEVPRMREPYVEGAQMAYAAQNWAMTLFLAREALAIPNRSEVYINMGYAWDETPDDLCAIACYWLGFYDDALRHAKAALAFSPESPRLQQNLRRMETCAPGKQAAL